MEKISGYARILARMRVESQLNKPLLGKPYLKYGQCFPLWSYFFQLGGILGAKHSSNLDAFGPAFLSARGEPGALRNFFNEVAKRLVTDYDIDSMTFADYVSKEFIGRVGYSGDADRFFLEHGMEKMKAQSATELAWQYSQQGAALGAIYSPIVRKMFERSHALVPKEEWEFARAAGLNIPPEQEQMTYKEIEGAEDGLFMAYCQECCPDFYTSLTAPGDERSEFSTTKAIDKPSTILEVGRDMSWADIVNQVFRILEFDRSDTTIDQNDRVKAQSAFEPYGYLIVESPILDHRVKLPIVHRDDFGLASTVFDEPKLANVVVEEDLLVTYVPEHLLPKGLAGSTSHVLHYVITPRGTLDLYYAAENEIHRTRPEPEKLFGKFVYVGEIRVQVNADPTL